MIFLIFLPIFTFAQEIPLDSGFAHYRCSFQSAKSVINHDFKIDKNFGNKCEYSITMDGKELVQGKAYAVDCRSFLKRQGFKGSVCLTSEI